MIESIITISVAALIAGFVFSMPIAGPISILITSNALNGRTRYCRRANIGAASADFIYVFLGVFGVTRLYSHYSSVIPYVMLAGAIGLGLVGVRIARTTVDFRHLMDEGQLAAQIEKRDRGGLRTGFLLNFLNPSLFLGWLTTSFLVMSFLASMGLSTAGLEVMLDDNVKAVNHAGAGSLSLSRPAFGVINGQHAGNAKPHEATGDTTPPTGSHVIVSVCYAFFLSLGSVLWFSLLTTMLARNRHRVNGTVINGIIRALGVVLCVFGIVLAYTAVRMMAGSPS